MSNIIAVTGSMACGKSHTCRKIVELAMHSGFSVQHVDVDVLRAQLLEGQTNPLQENLKRLFGREICNNTGGIDRQKLAAIIYSDPKSLRAHDEVFFPFVQKVIENLSKSSHKTILLEWALIVEKKCLHLSNYDVILVHCSHQRQLQRLQGGDLPVEQQQLRIALQYNNSKKEDEIRQAQSQFSKGRLFKLDTETETSEADYEQLLSWIINVSSSERYDHV